MSFLYKNKIFLKTKRINYLSSVDWRRIFLKKKNPIYNSNEEKIYSKNSVVTPIHLNQEVKIYAGKKWYSKKINKWAVGFKFGEFVWTRKIAFYKNKQLKKKKKKLKKKKK